MKHKISEIDFLRGFSISTIVLMHLLLNFHLPNIIRLASSFGGAGVHTFFFCSGFGLYLSYLNKPLNYLDFIRKRFSKVYWPYLIVLLLYLLKDYILSNEQINYGDYFSHVFLYKMFDSKLDVSICYPFWFISTIIQFYLFWPLIVKLKEQKYGLHISVAVSLSWWIIVSWLGELESRPYNSFFLQYLWEFVLGMHIATICNSNGNFFESLSIKLLSVLAIIGISITGFMGIAGGALKLFNDVPSFLGYTSLALLICKLSLPYINKQLEYTNKISYEWYLVHCLVFAIVLPLFKPLLPTPLVVPLVFVLSYISAILYDKLLKVIKIK